MDNETARQRTTTYIVSSCLIGLKTRYDGNSKPCQKVKDLVEEGIAVPFCPEQCGGLPTPRPAAEIAGGDGHDVIAGRARVLNADDADVTDAYLRGAEGALQLARMIGATIAVLASRSPSCGAGAIYNGTFSGTIVEGDGVTAALLKEAGLDVVTEKEFANDDKDNNIHNG
ncbi:MAG TPA: DUF523 domain-containing protein [Candidatus Aquicultor sp.]